MGSGRKKIVLQADRPAIGRPNRFQPLLLASGGAFLLAFVMAYLLFSPGPSTVARPTEVETLPQEVQHREIDGVVRQPIRLADLLDRLGVEADTRDRLLRRAGSAADRTVHAGALYRITYGRGEEEVRNLLLTANDTTLLRFQFLPYGSLEIERREIEQREVRYAGLITKNFWLAILENDSLHHSLIPHIEAAMKWTVDLFHLQPGDRFKLVYREQLRDGQVMGIDELSAIRIQTPQSHLHRFCPAFGGFRSLSGLLRQRIAAALSKGTREVRYRYFSL